MRKMLTVRCKDCSKEVTENTGSCGCPNMVRVNGDVVTAIDLNRTIMVRLDQVKEKNALSAQELAWQEQRRKRKVRKLNYEVR